MKRKIINYSFLIIIGIFLFMFFFGNTVFKYELTEKRDLTEEQILKFEEDIKNGIEIDIEDYVVKDKNYDNKITDVNKNISSIINYGFKKIFEYLLKNVEV